MGELGFDTGFFASVLGKLKRRKTGWSAVSVILPKQTFAIIWGSPISYTEAVIISSKQVSWAICLGRSLYPEQGRIILMAIQLSPDQAHPAKVIARQLSKPDLAGLLFVRTGQSFLNISDTSRWLDSLLAEMEVEDPKTSDDGLRQVARYQPQDAALLAAKAAAAIRKVLGLPP